MAHYDGLVRQVIVTDLGHGKPLILLTNQMTRTATHLVGRCAQRMIIESGALQWHRSDKYDGRVRGVGRGLGRTRAGSSGEDRLELLPAWSPSRGGCY